VYDRCMKTNPTGFAVAYYRVSTKRQGESGLGLEAQQAAVETFGVAHGVQIVESFQDIESGKHDSRPGLLRALARCKDLGATLLIAKLDRLSRNVAFIFTLRDSGVDFVACDLPEASTITVGLMAVLAQQEREWTSSRTKAALQALKARGVKLGVPKGTDRFGVHGRKLSAEAKLTNALRRANGALRTAVALRGEGWTVERIAGHLRDSGYKTPRGLEYQHRHVRHLLALAAKAGIVAKEVARDGARR